MTNKENCIEVKCEKDLQEALKAKDKAIALFYASWCPYSRRFLPIFEEHTKKKKGEYLKVMLDEMEDVAEKYDIDVYPTVLFFEKGKVTKRLDGIPGEGLDEGLLVDFVNSCKI